MGCATNLTVLQHHISDNLLDDRQGSLWLDLLRICTYKPTSDEFVVLIGLA